MFSLPEIQTTHDLSTEEGLRSYLVGTPFAASSVVQISGGSSCYTFRATLDVSYEDKGSGLVAQSVIIKHAREYSSGFKDISLKVERMVNNLYDPSSYHLKTQQDVEVASMRIVPELPFYKNNSISPKIRLARVLAYDQKNHVVILEDFGPLPSLKDYILASSSSTADVTTIAHEVGEILGQFLAHMHLWGYKLLHSTTPTADSDISILDPFRNNQVATEAKKICAWRTAGRLSEIVGRYDDMKVECDWEAFVKRLEGEVLEKEETFTMGDFWFGLLFLLTASRMLTSTCRTGNILVKPSTESPALEQLVILDWEIAKLGTSAADIGQFAAESLLLARYATSHEPGRALVGSFVDTYEATLISSTKSQSDRDGDSAGRALATLFDGNAIVGCTAAHTAVWGTLGVWNVDSDVKERAVKGALKMCGASARGEFEGAHANDLTTIWNRE
jgi:hypothetical protein